MVQLEIHTFFNLPPVKAKWSDSLSLNTVTVTINETLEIQVDKNMI